MKKIIQFILETILIFIVLVLTATAFQFIAKATAGTMEVKLVSKEKRDDLRHDGCMVGIYRFQREANLKKPDFNFLMKFCEDTINELNEELEK